MATVNRRYEASKLILLGDQAFRLVVLSADPASGNLQAVSGQGDGFDFIPHSAKKRNRQKGHRRQ